MTKAIILSNGVVKQMSFEEVLKQFDQMINKFANQGIEKIIYNKPEKEEVLQELRIQTWEAYRRYNGINAFSTYLVPRLQHGIHKATMKMYAKKRTYKGAMIRIDEEIDSKDGNKMTVAELVGEEDIEITSIPFQQLMEYLNETLDTSEKLMLKTMMNKKEFSIARLANVLGMSRMGAHKKYHRFVEKMAKILREAGYVAC